MNRRQGPKPSQRKRNAQRQSVCLRRLQIAEARRDKKAFLSNQCKEIEENNRIGETRDLFKKTGDTKGSFNAKTGTIKDRNDKDLTEAEEFNKRWQEYIEELYKKGLNDLSNHFGVLTHLESDIPECEVKSILGSITSNKASGIDGKS